MAWITDELGKENARPYYLRAGQVGNAGALVGIVASVILASIDLALPILVTGAGLILLGIWLAVFMPEDRFTRYERPEGERFRTGFGKTFREGVTRSEPITCCSSCSPPPRCTGLHRRVDRLADYHLIRDIGLPPIGDLDRWCRSACSAPHRWSSVSARWRSWNAGRTSRGTCMSRASSRGSTWRSRRWCWSRFRRQVGAGGGRVPRGRRAAGRSRADLHGVEQ